MTVPTRTDLETAVAAYWQTKDSQAAAARLLGSSAEGTAGSVRAAGHFAPIAAVIARFFLDAGYPPASIGTGRPWVVLPAVFRPTKQWDLAIIHRGVLVAAIELKGIGGDKDSIGRNYNNRVEEALGNALDLWRANDQGLVGPEKPWLGYFFLMEDTPTSRARKRPMTGFFPADPIWTGLSQQERFAMTAQRLLNDGLYDAVCYLASSRYRPGPREPLPAADWQHFAASIQARITYLANLGYP
jgi:hypothetical protein